MKNVILSAMLALLIVDGAFAQSGRFPISAWGITPVDFTASNDWQKERNNLLGLKVNDIEGCTGPENLWLSNVCDYTNGQIKVTTGGSPSYGTGNIIWDKIKTWGRYGLPNGWRDSIKVRLADICTTYARRPGWGNILVAHELVYNQTDINGNWIYTSADTFVANKNARANTVMNYACAYWRDSMPDVPTENRGNTRYIFNVAHMNLYEIKLNNFAQQMPDLGVFENDYYLFNSNLPYDGSAFQDGLQGYVNSCDTCFKYFEKGNAKSKWQSIIQTGTWDKWVSGQGWVPQMRLPTREEIRLQAWVALSRGAKGMSYFLYFSATAGSYSFTGLVDGNRVPRDSVNFPNDPNTSQYRIYDWVKELNDTLLALGPTLTSLHCQDAFKISSLPANCYIKNVASSPDTFFEIGLFKDKDSLDYFMLVNRHCLPGDTVNMNVTINYTPKIGQPNSYFITDVLYDQPVTGQLAGGVAQTITIKLLPGGGRLLRIVPFASAPKINNGAINTNFRFVPLSPNIASTLSNDSVQITQKYYTTVQPDTQTTAKIAFGYWKSIISGWLPYNASTIQYLQKSEENKQNIFELQFKIGGGKILTPKYSSQIFFNDVSPVNGAITINNNANFTNSQTVNVKLSGTDLFPGLSQMRYAEAPFGNDSGYANLVKNGTFEDTTNWVLDNAEFYDCLLHLKGYHTGPGPTQIGSSSKQIIPGSEISQYRNKLLRYTDDIYAHDVTSSYKIVDLFYADTLQPNSVRLLEKPMASTPEVVWKSSSDTFTIKADTLRPLDRIEISYNIYGIEVPPPPPGDDPLFNTIVVDNIRLEPVELKSGAQPDITPPASYYIYDGWDYADTNYSYSYMLSSGDGTKRVYMQLGDLAGNISSEPGWYDDIVLDMTAPWTTIHSPQNGANVSVDTFSVWCTVTDNFVIKSWSLELKQHNLTAWQTVKEGLYGIKKRPIHINCDSLGMLGGRYYDFRLTATDSAGNSGQTTITIYYCHEVEPALCIDPEFATFNSLPVDATCDNFGNIYVTDTQADKIWKFSPEGDSLLCFGYKYTGQDTLGLNHPKGIAVDDSGNIWITDCYQSKVKKYDGQGNYISTIGKHGNKAGEFNQPTGIAISGNEIYVVDHLNDRVQVFNKTGAFIRQFGNNCLKQPAGIAIRNSETEKLVYVCDSQNDRIVIFDTTGNLVNSIDSLGLDKPWDICFDNNNNLYIADVYNNRVIELDPWHNKLLTFGIHGQEAGQFKLPQGLAVSPDGKYLYVADTHNDRLQRFKMFFDMETLGGPQTSGKRQITDTTPTVFGLSQCYPNPCKQSTNINYQIAKPGPVSIKVYNTLGQAVKTLVNENQQPGYYTINWDGRDESNRQVATGVYFYRLASGEYKNTKKIVLLR